MLCWELDGTLDGKGTEGCGGSQTPGVQGAITVHFELAGTSTWFSALFGKAANACFP